MTEKVRRTGLNERVVALHTEHPDWPVSRIAAELQASHGYVLATAKRKGLAIPTRRQRTEADAAQR